MSQLDPVQIAALRFAWMKPGVGWFLEQGLGKTLCALAEFNALYERGRADRMLVVCPNTFKQGWLDEIEKHGFNFHVHIFQSAKKRENTDFFQQQHHSPVLIINYEAARMKEVTAALVRWAEAGKTYLAIDESIQIKGYKTAQTKAVHQLAAWSPHTSEPTVCRFIRLLTGRPQTQGPHDLWGQLRAIGLFRSQNFWSFRGTFCVMGGWEMKEVVAAQNVELLASKMAPAVFQAKKRDWLPTLPRKDATIRDYQMSGEQKKQYDMMEEEFLVEIDSGYVTVDVAIAKYAKLAQIQCGFVYDEHHTAHQLVEPGNNPRLKLLLQLLEEEIEGKVCIVYRHRPMLDFLRTNLGRTNPITREFTRYPTTWISGGMKPDETSEQKARFNEDPHCRIILLQCDAAKYGFTLLGGPGPDDLCRTMIFFENSYSADTRDQIEDRIHRRGQTGERVLYIDLSGSELDRRIVKALQRKDSLYRSVFRNLKEAVPA